MWDLTSNIQEANAALNGLVASAAAASATLGGLRFSAGGALPAASESPTDATADDPASAQAELNIIEIDEQAARLQEDLDAHQKLVDAEDAVATKMGDHVTDLQDALSKQNDQLQQMRDAAGVGDTSGVGAEKKKLTDDLNEANARLTYLEDTSKGTKEDLAAIALQKKVVDDLTIQLDDAEKRLRIADYELTHSDAWKKQLQVIADQQAMVAAAQKQQADEQVHLDAMKADLAAREAAAQKLADERAKQQAILDKQQQDAQAAATAQRKIDLENELGLLTQNTQLHTFTIHAAAAEAVTKIQAAVGDGVAQISDAAVDASQSIAVLASNSIAAAGEVIQQQLAAEMQELMSYLGGPPQDSQDVPGGPGGRDFGSQYGGGFFDETGQQAGGAIGDPTYATWVQAFIDAKKRYEDDYKTPGMQQYQAQEVVAMQQLERIWQQLGGFNRFHETLAQIVAALEKQSTAIGTVAKKLGPSPGSTGNMQFHPPNYSTPTSKTPSLPTVIRTGHF